MDHHWISCLLQGKNKIKLLRKNAKLIQICQPKETEKEIKIALEKENKLQRRACYLLINKISPEPGVRSLVRIRWQQRRLVVPDLVYVLNDDEGLTYLFPVVDENRDLLVNRVHLVKQIGLVPQVLLLVLVLNPLLSQSDPDPHPKHAGQGIQQNHLLRHSHNLSKKISEIKDKGECEYARYLYIYIYIYIYI